MFRNRRGASLIALFASFALVAAACGDDDDTTTTADNPSASDPADSGSGGSPSAPAEGGGEGSSLPECLDFADLYALTGPESEGFDNWADAESLAAELGSDTELPDQALSVAGPGEESGTFDTYVEFVVEGLAEERGVEEIAPRSDYQSSPNDNVIVDNLAASDGSLGWVGFAFFVENTDRLKAFELSNLAEDVDCTEPTPETIASGEYPMSRPLFIYVNNAKAEANGTLSNYVDRYLGDLADCVTSGGYVALEDSALAETVETWEATGFSGGEPDGSSLDISGSSTVEPISQCVLDESGLDGSVEGPGTGDGFQRFCDGETDISDASRPIKEAEAETCAANGIEFTELQVAIDGIAVMTEA